MRFRNNFDSIDRIAVTAGVSWAIGMYQLWKTDRTRTISQQWRIESKNNEQTMDQHQVVKLKMGNSKPR